MCTECCSQIQPSAVLLELYISMNCFRYGHFVYRRAAIVWGAQLSEQSVNAVIIRSYFQLLFKDPSTWLGSYGRGNNIRTRPFFQVIDWHALQERRVKPPEKLEIVEVSSTDPVFISCHKQLLLTSQGNLGNKGIITSTTVMKKCKFRYVLCWKGGTLMLVHTGMNMHACLCQYIV